MSDENKLIQVYQLLPGDMMIEYQSANGHLSRPYFNCQTCFTSPTPLHTNSTKFTNIVLSLRKEVIDRIAISEFDVRDNDFGYYEVTFLLGCAHVSTVQYKSNMWCKVKRIKEEENAVL